MDNLGASPESRGRERLTQPGWAGSVRVSPEGPNDTNGSDRINAHVTRRFLRALPCPAGIIPAVAPFLLLLAGFAALAGGIVTLRGYGPRLRVARLLATTPRATVAEAIAAAAAGPRYLRIDGRIDSEEEFEDAHHQPLVFRRTRFQARAGRRWVDFEDGREAVHFEVRDGLTAIAIDGAALGVGLVVLPREALGVADDVPDRAPAGLAGATPVRAVVEQISAVDHAVVLGVPTVSGDEVLMTAGLGRPLVLTTLEVPEALRVIGSERRGRPVVAGMLLAGGVLLVGLGVMWTIATAIGGTAAAADVSFGLIAG